MNGLTGSTAFISILVAVILWSLATWLEGETDEADVRAVEATHAFVDEVTSDTEIRSDGVMQSCRSAENTIREIVDASQSCTVDDDCTIFDYGYPIQCLTSIAKAEIPKLRREYQNYQESCEYRVYYDCPSAPLRRQAVCRNSRCAVELQTIDILKNETLDHIGIDSGNGPGAVPRNRRSN